MCFIIKPWEEITDEEKQYLLNLTKEELQCRWNTKQGKEIIAEIIKINLNYGKSSEYKKIIGTIKDTYDDKKPKFDFRGIQFDNFSCIKNNEIFSFDFSNCNLKYSNFSNSVFTDANFSKSSILYSDLRNSIFDGCNFNGCNLTLTSFKSSSLEYANLKNVWMTDVNFTNANLGYVSYNNKTDFQNIDVKSVQGSSNPLFVDYLQRKQYLKNFKHKEKVTYYIWWIISDCGQSFFRWFISLLVICLLWGVIYSSFPNSFAIANGRENTGFTYYYYSIVTFTTLGFGDIVPVDLFGEIIVSVEVIIGYIMLGGLLSILSDKFIPKR